MLRLVHPVFRSLATAAVLAWSVGGCAQTFDVTTVGVEATMASPANAPAQGEAFRVNRKAVYLLAGVLPVSKPSLERVLNSQLTGDARVADLRIRVRSRWSDVLITILTAGLVVPRSVTYEGVIVGQ
ncbi:MAG: hypothetical protein PVF27_04900 [Gemmatimonadales bacterium]